jgi:hypothetical protein
MKLPLAEFAGRVMFSRQCHVNVEFLSTYHGTHATLHITEGGPETYAQYSQSIEMKERRLMVPHNIHKHSARWTHASCYGDRSFVAPPTTTGTK